MISHDYCLLADNSHEISYLIFFKLGKMSENLSSAAVVIRALKVKEQQQNHSIRTNSCSPDGSWA